MAGTAEITGTTLTGAAPKGADMDLSATAAPGTNDLIILENTAFGIYEAVLEGEIVAGVIYSKAVNRVALLATSVFPAFRGRGIPARLLSSLFDRLRVQGVTVTLTCPFAAEFAAEFLSVHPEYAAVLDMAAPGTSSLSAG